MRYHNVHCLLPESFVPSFHSTGKSGCPGGVFALMGVGLGLCRLPRTPYTGSSQNAPSRNCAKEAPEEDVVATASESANAVATVVWRSENRSFFGHSRTDIILPKYK